MKKVLFLVKSFEEARLFSQTANFLPQKLFFLTLRLDIFLFLKIKGKKVFYLPPKKEKDFKSADLEKIAFFEREKRKIFHFNNESFWQKLAFQKKFCHLILKKINPDLVILWNGFYALDRICKKGNFPILYLENGFFKNTLQADKKGVNYVSSLKDICYSKKGREKIYQFNQARALFLKKKMEKQTGQKPKLNMKKIFGELIFSPRGSRFLFFKNIIRGVLFFLFYRDLDPGNDFWLILLQQDFDSQTILFSPFLKNKKELVKIIVNKVPKQEKIVFKPHPGDLGREDFLDLRKIIAKRRNSFFICKKSLGWLLRRCKGLIILNSSSVFEAMAFQKPIFCLGNAFYDKIEGVKKILPQSLSDIKEFSFDAKKTDSFLCFLEKKLIKNNAFNLAQEIKRRI